MSTLRSGGFTIIETMLFLAISGIMVVAMITGVGASVNIQRYRDAVETLKSFLQDQYAELASVKNSRDKNSTWACDNQANTQEVVGGRTRGQSDCELLGRYVTIVDDTATVYTVVGREKEGSGEVSNDLTDIEKVKEGYTLNVSTVEKETSTMEWGTRIAWPTKGGEGHAVTTPRSISILFLRSPVSGQIFTFSSDKVPEPITSDTLSSMLVVGDTYPPQAGLEAGQSPRTICVDSNGVFVNADYSIYINAFANGPTAIESRSNDFIISENLGDTQC